MTSKAVDDNTGKIQFNDYKKLIASEWHHQMCQTELYNFTNIQHFCNIRQFILFCLWFLYSDKRFHANSTMLCNYAAIDPYNKFTKYSFKLFSVHVSNIQVHSII